jgi:hypothetical protein
MVFLYAFRVCHLPRVKSGISMVFLASMDCFESSTRELQAALS